MPLGLYMPAHAALMADQAGQKWRPSNGIEGCVFMDRWCEECAKLGLCDIPMKTMAFDVDDAEYPEQWQHGEDGQPKCTVFEPANP